MRQSSLIATGIALALLLTAGVKVAAAAMADMGRSEVKYVAKESEVDLSGSFRKFSAEVDVDPAHPQDGHVKVVIDLASADAGSADADNLLKSKEFFDVAHFPSATFEATAISAGADGRLQASGPFTLKGHTGNIVLPFTARRDGGGLWFEGSTRISRLAYGVGQGQWSDTGSLDDAVLIQFKIQVVH